MSQKCPYFRGVLLSKVQCEMRTAVWDWIMCPYVTRMSSFCSVAIYRCHIWDTTKKEILKVYNLDLLSKQTGLDI
jgi:hypothetical protein